MGRVSLRTVAVLIPLLCAVGFAVWSQRRNARRTQALEMYQASLARGETLPLGRLEREFGVESAIARGQESAKKNGEVVFDGESRVAQIERSLIVDENSTVDGISLYTFGIETRTQSYRAPLGAHIDAIHFNDTAMEVTLHGMLKMGSYEFEIDKSNPQTYEIEWLPHDVPKGNLYGAVWERHKDEAKKSPQE